MSRKCLLCGRQFAEGDKAYFYEKDGKWGHRCTDDEPCLAKKYVEFAEWLYTQKYCIANRENPGTYSEKLVDYGKAQAVYLAKKFVKENGA